jgi:hypothetical protein
MKKADLLRFNGAVERDPAIDAWMKAHAGDWEPWRIGGLR